MYRNATAKPTPKGWQAPTTVSAADLDRWQEELLEAAYVYHFTQGAAVSESGLAWCRWAASVGLTVVEVAAAVAALAERHLVELAADALGEAVARLLPEGVQAAEAGGLAEPAFIARQKNLRRRILVALAWVRESEGRYAGRSASRLATELSEPAGDVLTNCRVLVHSGHICDGVGRGRLLRATQDGISTLGVPPDRAEWPLG